MVSFLNPTLGCVRSMYIEHKKKKISKKGGVTRIVVPGCSGMNSNLMQDWAKNVWLAQSSQGDILLLDNLNAHKNKEVVKLLKSEGRVVINYPVRLAKFLSPNDNSFHHQFKVKYREFVNAKVEFTKEEKKTFVLQEYISTNKETIMNHFKNCKLLYEEDFLNKRINDVKSGVFSNNKPITNEEIIKEALNNAEIVVTETEHNKNTSTTVTADLNVEIEDLEQDFIEIVDIASGTSQNNLFLPDSVSELLSNHLLLELDKMQIDNNGM